MDSLPFGEMALRIGAAVGLAALVGLERERKHRPAGFRTMILISLGSAGFMMLGEEAIRSFGGATGQAEISRILQGLMGGVGFLGAGAVIQNKKAVRGLTTAAAVWVTSAVGAACGMGMYKLAALVTFAQLFTLVILEYFEETYFPDHFANEDETNGKARVERAVLDGEGQPLEPKE